MAALVLIVVVGAGVLVLLDQWDWVSSGSAAAEAPDGTVQAVSTVLFEDWVLAFEVTSLLLVVAAAGAIALAYFRPIRKRRRPR